MKTSSQLIITFGAILIVLFVAYLTTREGHHLLDEQRNSTVKVVYY